MPGDAPYVLTIGGFDPSNGAGITADVKTFAHFGVHGLAVQTCLTIQHDSEVRNVYWHSSGQIGEQLAVLRAKYNVSWVKLSLSETPESALQVAGWVKQHWPDARILWDPVLRASSGYAFAEQQDPETLRQLLGRTWLALPNRQEMAHWSALAPETAAAEFSRLTKVLLKGGHNAEHPGRDVLYAEGAEVSVFEPARRAMYEKHGSGCVFGSALLSLLALDRELPEAIREAKAFILDYLDSDPGLLGRHRIYESTTQPHGL